MNTNDKQITKAMFKSNSNHPIVLYNLHRFESPINQQLSIGLLKRRSREYSRTHISIKNKFCRKCFSFKNIQRHHPDYKNPEKIMFLCRTCHYKIHVKKRKKFAGQGL